jgi:hypothetical protein
MHSVSLEQGDTAAALLAAWQQREYAAAKEVVILKEKVARPGFDRLPKSKQERSLRRIEQAMAKLAKCTENRQQAEALVQSRQRVAALTGIVAEASRRSKHVD